MDPKSAKEDDKKDKAMKNKKIKQTLGKYFNSLVLNDCINKNEWLITCSVLKLFTKIHKTINDIAVLFISHDMREIAFKIRAN